MHGSVLRVGRASLLLFVLVFVALLSFAAPAYAEGSSDTDASSESGPPDPSVSIVDGLPGGDPDDYLDRRGEPDDYVDRRGASFVELLRWLVGTPYWGTLSWVTVLVR